MNAESVKARLKNFAVTTGHTFQEALIYYGLERTIYRISISKYADHFVLKGGIFLYALFDRNYERVTTDVDLLARRISNRREEIQAVFHDILSQDVDDALIFDPDSIMVDNITEFKEYHGLHVSVTGHLDRTKIPIGIDIGFGDVIYPEVVKMSFPVILDMEPPVVNAYSMESSIAEKLEAIIYNGYLNSRYKDFYDIYVLTKKYSFSYSALRRAVEETFRNRKTSLQTDSAAFGEVFLNDPIHQRRWNSFLKKKNALLHISLDETMERIKIFAQPLLEENKKTVSQWNPDRGHWE